MERPEVMQIIEERLRNLNLDNHYDIFCREHNPLDGTHKESGAIEPSSFNAPWIDVRECGAKRDGRDDTAAFQAAFAASRAGKYPRKVYIPDGDSIITDTLEVTSGMVIEGSNKSIWSGQTGVDNKPNCLITFAPTSEKDLFYVHETTPATGNYASNINISNLALKGNTVGGVTDSRYAFNLKQVSQSVFKNIGVYHFYIPVYSSMSMTNRFKNVYLGYSGSSCFYYDEEISTSDVWEGCIFRSGPSGGVIKNGFGIVFDHCLFESLSLGVEIYRECGEITLNSPYVENVPTDDNGFVFSVGYSGTTTWVGNQLTIIGGLYSGRIEGSGGITGSWLVVKYCKGIRIFGGNIIKYDYGIRSSDHTVTDNNSIFVSGPSFRNVTTLYEDVEGSYGKIYGHYPTGNLDVATVPKVRGNKIQIIALSIYANNAAAIAGGLAVGDFYRTNANPDTVCVVH